jgi:DNA/RNA-binding domain of Phe-tRNA-synthetase-like protein
MFGWKALQLQRSRCQKRLRSLAVVSPVVVEGSGGLNQPLQKCLLRLAFLQPQLFPNLVRPEKLARVEKRQAALKFVVVGHRYRARRQLSIDFLLARKLCAAKPDHSSVFGGVMDDIQVELPGVVLGVLEADAVRVEPAGPDLSQLMDAVSEILRRKFTLESLAESEPSRAVRAMFRAWGVDPSKYRPSSEALQRRVVQGKGLYRVSNVVDIGNLGTIETGWPYGLYDRSKIAPPIVLRLGAHGETYEGIGKRAWHLEKRPVLADSEKPFGSPISDSTRSMVTDSTRDVLAVIYAPETAPRSSIQQALARLADRLTRFAASSATRSAIPHED